MKGRMIRIFILFYILFPFLLKGVVLSRDDVILTASQYVNIGEWTPKVDSTKAVTPTWHSWYTTLWGGNDSLNISPPYDRLAYCWGIVMLQFKIKGEERISRIYKNRKWRLA